MSPLLPFLCNCIMVSQLQCSTIFIPLRHFVQYLYIVTASFRGILPFFLCHNADVASPSITFGICTSATGFVSQLYSCAARKYFARSSNSVLPLCHHLGLLSPTDLITISGISRISYIAESLRISSSLLTSSSKLFIYVHISS